MLVILPRAFKHTPSKHRRRHAKDGQQKAPLHFHAAAHVSKDTGADIEVVLMSRICGAPSASKALYRFLVQKLSLQPSTAQHSFKQERHILVDAGAHSYLGITSGDIRTAAKSEAEIGQRNIFIGDGFLYIQDLHDAAESRAAGKWPLQLCTWEKNTFLRSKATKFMGCVSSYASTWTMPSETT